MLPPTVQQYFVPVRGAKPAGTVLVYKPQVFGCGQVYYVDKKNEIDENVDVAFLAEITDDAVAVDWDNAKQVELADSDLEKDPAADSLYAPLPREAAKPKNYDTWKKSLVDWLFRNQKLSLWRSDALGATSKPNEPEREFRVRLQQDAREERDRTAEQLRQKFAPKIAALDEKIRKAQASVESKKSTSLSSKIGAALSFGATVLGAFLSRKTLSATSINKATTAVRARPVDEDVRRTSRSPRKRSSAAEAEDGPRRRVPGGAGEARREDRPRDRHVRRGGGAGEEVEHHGPGAGARVGAVVEERQQDARGVAVIMRQWSTNDE